jgi:hypothetical protein
MPEAKLSAAMAGLESKMREVRFSPGWAPVNSARSGRMLCSCRHFL